MGGRDVTHPVAGQTVRDGHVGHEVAEELVPQGGGPLADQYVHGTHGAEGGSVDNHGDEVAASLLRTGGSGQSGANSTKGQSPEQI